MTTNKMTHTPGPWEIRDVAGTGQMFSIMSPSSIPEGRYVIATLPRTHGTENLRTQESDAALIVAAPELLEAIKLALRYPGLIDKNAKEAMRAALLRAEGGR